MNSIAWLHYAIHGEWLPSKRRHRRKGPPRSAAYRSFIRRLPCAICGSHCGIEAAHTGPHGLGQKSSDFTCIPLCSQHHQTGRDALHRLGPRGFEAVHRVSLEDLGARCRALWEK